MPEHIHLLISEPERGDPSKVMQAVKQGFARRVLREQRKRRMVSQLAGRNGRLIPGPHPRQRRTGDGERFFTVFPSTCYAE